MNDGMITMLIALAGIVLAGVGSLIYFKWEEHRSTKKKHAH